MERYGDLKKRSFSDEIERKCYDSGLYARIMIGEEASLSEEVDTNRKK